MAESWKEWTFGINHKDNVETLLKHWYRRTCVYRCHNSTRTEARICAIHQTKLIGLTCPVCFIEFCRFSLKALTCAFSFEYKRPKLARSSRRYTPASSCGVHHRFHLSLVQSLGHDRIDSPEWRYRLHLVRIQSDKAEYWILLAPSVHHFQAANTKKRHQWKLIYVQASPLFPVIPVFVQLFRIADLPAHQKLTLRIGGRWTEIVCMQCH